MLTMLCYVIAAFGLAYVLGHSIITKKPREWAYALGFGRKLVPVEPNEVIKHGSHAFAHRFYPLRWLVELIECPMCCGWHSGFWFWILFVIRYPPDGIHYVPSVDIPIGFIVGFFTAGSNFILGRATGLVDNPRGH